MSGVTSTDTKTFQFKIYDTTIDTDATWANLLQAGPDATYYSRNGIQLGHNGKLRIICGGLVKATSGSALLTVNTWHTLKLQVAMLDSGYVKLYVDGVLQLDSGTTDCNVAPASQNMTYARYGGWDPTAGTAPAWTYYVDDFKVGDGAQ